VSKGRTELVARAGPPKGPGALRVSTTRHGTTATNTRGGVKSVIVVIPPDLDEAVYGGTV
jgi:hypothetical protein